MTLKAKLTWGLAFLFFIILALSGFCSYYVGALGHESENILKDNYYSVAYARNMLSGLDDMKSSVTNTVYNTARSTSDYYARLFESGKSTFETNLKAEKGNITEIPEKEYVDALSREYETYLSLCTQMRNGSGGGPAYFGEFVPACDKLKQSINAIYDVNMQAIVRKSQLASQDSSRFLNYMAIIGSLCLVLAVAYFWYFPVYISTTLSYLADKMRNLLKGAGIAFDLKTNDESYVLLHGLDLLEDKLGVKAQDPGRGEL